MNTQFNFDSQPNAGKLINSLRHLGYTNYSAIADLVDNCFDADAKTVKILARQRDNNPEIIIADDGFGMGQNTLEQAIRLGSLVDKNEDSDLGKFGMGLCTASLSICRQTIVLTKTEDGQLLKAINDVDEVIKQGKFVSYLGSADLDESILFDELTSNSGHGTIVILRNCDKLSNKNLSIFSGILGKELSRIFRYFLNANRNICINEKELVAFDPLGWGNLDTNRFDESEIEISIKGISEFIKVKTAILPTNLASGEKDKDLNIRNQGFYLMRNNREIIDATTLGLFTKHNDFNPLRIELSFSGNLDDLMGVNFMKREVNIEQSLIDKLNNYFSGQLKTIRNRIKREKSTETPDEIQDIHSDVSQEIRKKSKLLMTPKAPKELRSQRESKASQATEKNESENIRNPSPDRQQTGGFTADCEFKSANMGNQGVIYSTEQIGRKIIITYNSDHPFYSRFILENGLSDKRFVAGVDFLIYSLACAELQQNNEDEEVVSLIDNFKTIMSVNLRTLLS